MLLECANSRYGQHTVHYIQGDDIKYSFQSRAGAILSRIQFTCIKLLFESITSYLFASPTDIDVNSDVVCLLVLTLLSSSFRSFRDYPKWWYQLKTDLRLKKLIDKIVSTVSITYVSL